ncbi:MAG: hypothetical protein ACT4O1_13555 [Gemmatimonadota bacterium]
MRRLFDDFEAGLKNVPAFDGKRIGIITGTRMAEALQPLVKRLARQTRSVVSVLSVVNN